MNNGLAYLEKLLDGVEVEWVELGNLCRKISSGKNKKKNTNGFYPVFGSTGVIGRTDNKAYEIEQILVARVGANAGRVYIAQGEYDVSDNTLIVQNTDSVILKYLYYYLVNARLNQFAQGAGQPLITGGQLKSLLIPIPCPDNPQKSLEIQAEIVRILDAFTAYTAELTAELTARKKQYQYYRDQLLSFEDGDVEWKTLGWIGDVRMCKRILKNQTSDSGDIPFFKIGTFGKDPDAYISRAVFDEYKERYNYPRVGEILISASGTIGRAVIFNGEDAYFQDSNIVWLENDETKVLNKYLFYFYQIAKWNVSDGGVIKRLYNDNIKKTLIPIPFPNNLTRSLSEQGRIVAILDKFEALTNSISEGLPREIELRQKQYEYYRDQLLSFPKPDSESAA